MTLREVCYLSETVELKHLVNKNNLTLKVVDNQKIYLTSKCLVFEIYGLVVEDFFYFDFYSIDLNLYSSLDRILSDFDSGKLHSVYQKQIDTRKEVLISYLQGNKESTLRAEQYFFTMLQLMDEILTEIMSCKKQIGEQHWTKIFDHKRKELESVLNAV
ncbi:hypothetical protein EGI26_07170 [Lacihabitans sp. CCS-44]|uniref:hypothetical protein n=1 Tax=Lacihabitans sp. CCS-44 TaxID=2487331 RepID=UPI0020CF3C3B|nr:hypothetical protein [Lacihabitans sp. CCS-44]MCP9754932.1 hypothetical protein [Lacihabitans sp. CCS-44]